MFNPERLLGGLLSSGMRGRSGLGSLMTGGAALGLVENYFTLFILHLKYLLIIGGSDLIFNWILISREISGKKIIMNFQTILAL